MKIDEYYIETLTSNGRNNKIKPPKIFNILTFQYSLKCLNYSLLTIICFLDWYSSLIASSKTKNGNYRQMKSWLLKSLHDKVHVSFTCEPILWYSKAYQSWNEQIMKEIFFHDGQYIYEIKLATEVESEPKVPFSVATTPRCWEGAIPFPRLLHFILDRYLIMLRVNQGDIKYHFLSLWYDSTWDWIPVSRTIGEHSTHEVNEPVNIYIYIYIYITI